ncbi:Rieske (2Fe-2S) protein [Pseudonocardia aurantiaca]|uniref:Cytochrome bc1 complex Rieske iron-sulfur subunit n=1 Tax=Pseudonocardia aurantiaca TaxID=75290 RepID=A0ABW4FVV0_9PSEU
MSRRIRPDPTRRALVTGICGAATLTACGSGGGPTSPPSAPGPGSPAPSPTQAGGSPSVVARSDIPIGGGTVFPDYRLVVTRPTAGDVRAFTAICTHDGCLLATVADATIQCPCHGSRFAIADGAVVHGPALRALTPRNIEIQGDSIILNP